LASALFRLTRANTNVSFWGLPFAPTPTNKVMLLYAPFNPYREMNYVRERRLKSPNKTRQIQEILLAIQINYSHMARRPHKTPEEIIPYCYLPPLITSFANSRGREAKNH
jgi:hypothetical protein